MAGLKDYLNILGLLLLKVLSSLHLEVLMASSASAFAEVSEADYCNFLSAGLTAHCHSFSKLV